MSKQESILYEQIKDLLEANLKPLRKDIQEIYHLLDGNGQPGLFDRVRVLENNKFEFLGGWKTMLILTGGFAATINFVGHLLKIW